MLFAIKLFEKRRRVHRIKDAKKVIFIEAIRVFRAIKILPFAKCVETVFETATEIPAEERVSIMECAEKARDKSPAPSLPSCLI